MLCEFKKNKNAPETVKIFCSVYGQEVITNSQVQNWLSKFCSHDTSVSDEIRSERSSDIDLMLQENWWNAIYEEVL